MEHSEVILNVKSLEHSLSWARSVAKAKVCVFADSVLCVGQMRDTPDAIERWTSQVEGLKLYSSYQDAVGIDGEAIEFEWKTYPSFSSVSFIQEIQRDLEWHWVENEWWEWYSESRENQELRDEILARTLEILGSRVGRKVVWKFFIFCSNKRIWWNIQQNGTATQRNWSSCIQKVSVPRVVESWSTRKSKKSFTSMEIRQTQNSCFKHCILWSVNKLARAVTKWNQACDRRFARLISYIHRTNDFRQHCHVANPAQHRRLGVFQDSDFTGDHENSKLTSMDFLYLREWNIRSHKLDVQETNFSLTQFYPIWSDIVRCKSTWTEFPLLICGIILQFNPEHGATCCVINTQKHSNERTKKQSDTSKDLGWIDVDYVTSSAKTFSLRCFGLNFFVKTLKQQWRWLSKAEVGRYDTYPNSQSCASLANWKYQLGPKQSRAIVLIPKKQHANILPKRSFSRNEWNHLLCLFNISNLSMYSCSHISDFLSDEHRRKQSAMTKTGQKTTSNDGSPTAKATPCLVLGEQKNEDTSSRSLGSLWSIRWIPMKEEKWK